MLAALRFILSLCVTRVFQAGAFRRSGETPEFRVSQPQEAARKGVAAAGGYCLKHDQASVNERSREYESSVKLEKRG